MTFDVIIPSKDRPEDICRMIDSVFASSFHPCSIIIVDQSSNPYNLEQYEGKGIEIIHCKDSHISGASVARNVGIAKSKADVVYIFDDDIIIDKNFFEIINKHFDNHPEVVGICGRQKNSKSSRFKVLIFSLFHTGPFKDDRKKLNSGLITEGIYSVTMLSGGIVAYKRRVFSEYQFDDLFIKGSLGEDRDFSYRLSRKYPLMFATDALALHNHSRIGRYDAVEDYACKLATYSIFYSKNLEKNFANRVSYSLVVLGVFFDAVVYLAKHKSLDGFRGIRKGRKYIKNNYVGVPFIDSTLYRQRYAKKNNK